MTTSKKKRKCLLAEARRGLSLFEVNRILEEECLDTIHSCEWTLWTQYYSEIVKSDPYFEYELIDNNRSLAWFAKELNRRKRKDIIS